ncbi:DUF6907 domain-containing protein [Streptomyces sp. NPDC057540]|uniref:DUF6907 domain-containing protein n=1 Tax=Streptomyces sp. NPDC057540 TaxID=3346160 RepID=UPI0036A77583
MTHNRLITLPTTDHGDIALSDPGWCTGHASHFPGPRVDITHTGTEHTFAFAGDTLLVAMLSQTPFGPDPEQRRTGLYVEQPRWAATLDPVEIRQLAATLTVHAMHLRTLAEQLAVLRDEEGQR